MLVSLQAARVFQVMSYTARDAIVLVSLTCVVFASQFNFILDAKQKNRRREAKSRAYITIIHVHRTAVDVGTRDDKDILQWLQNTAREEDFVTLKFDVDNDFSLGPTMEWGFVADLLRSPKALALVDELFVELHFYAPSLRWVHLTHSMKQAFDVLRQLRACGLPVHAWP